MGECQQHLTAIGEHYDCKVRKGASDINVRISSTPGIVHHHEAWATSDEVAAIRSATQPQIEAFLYSKETEIVGSLAQRFDPAPECGSSILDAGCGRGGSALLLRKRYGAKITGISISRGQIEFAGRALQQAGCDGDVQFLVGDMTDTELPGNTFDYIWALGSTEHVDGLDEMGEEFYRLAKSSGQLLVYACTKNEGHDQAEHYASQANNWYQTRLHTVAEYVSALTDTGWKVAAPEDYTPAAANYWRIRTFLDADPGSAEFMAPALESNALNYHLLLARKP